MPAERDVDGGVAAQMAKIPRKPVSSAFYASDLPPIFAPDSPHPQTAERDRAPLSHHLRLELNDSSDTTLYGGDPVTAGTESHVNLLDVYNRTTSLEAGSQSPDPAVTKSRTTYKTSYIEDVSGLPTDDNHPSRVVQPVKPRPQESSDNYPTRQLWTPIWLKKRTLIAFAVLYIVLLLSVILLWHVSRDRNGFAPRISTNHYTWTYGPTAVLVIVVGLWRQVAYYSSVLAPWHEMKRGAESSRSLLLDYVSPFQVVSLWLAFRHRSISVIATILGFACLKLIIIFSTGLLVLSPIVVMNSTFPIEVRTDFDVTSPSKEPWSSPVLAYYAHFAYNLTWPVGAKDHLAYPSIGAKAKATLPPNSVISVEADVMLPQFDCEAAKIDIRPNNTNVAIFEAPSCIVESLYFGISGLRNQIYSSNQIVGQFSLVDCTSNTIIFTSDGPPLLDRRNDNRFIVTVNDYRYTQTPAHRTHGNSTPFEATATLDRVNGVICRPAYSIIKANLTYDTAKQDESDRYSISKPEVLAGKRLENFTVDDLSLALVNAIHTSGGINGDQERCDQRRGNQECGPYTDFVPETSGILSQLMLLTQGESSLEVFLTDIETMRSAAAKTLGGIASQYAQQSLLTPTSKSSIGQLVYPTDRLKVQTTSMALILSCLVLLILLTLIVLFYRPYDVVPRNPNSLGGMAVIIANSQYLQNLLLGLGRSPTDKIRHKLAKFYFTSYPGRDSHDEASFRIQVSDTQQIANIAKVPSNSSHWHRPVAIQKGFIASVLPLPLILIIVLEALQRASNRRNGFLTLQQDTAHESSSTNILIRYIPAFLVLLVATLFNMLDFTVTTFAPFSALRSGSSPVQRTIFSQLMSKPPPVALYRAAIDRHFGMFFSNIAGLTGSVLAIIASGLLIVESINVPSNVTVRQLDSFNINTYKTDDYNATATVSVMEQFNLSFPAFTYKDLAFPRIELLEESMTLVKAANTIDSMSLSVQLPALRASLDCKPVPPPGDILFSFFYDDGIPVSTLSFKLHQPHRCFGQHFPYLFHFRISYGQQPKSPYLDLEPSYFVGSISDTFSPEILLSDCPSFAFIFGNLKAHYTFYENLAIGKVKAKTTSYENVTFMTCSEHIQEVQAQATFTLPHFTIDKSHPPIIDESTIHLLKNNTSGLTAIQNDVIDKMRSLMPNLEGANESDYHFDNFFSTLAFGSDATPPEELLGPANAGKLFNRTNYLYSKYMTQVINSEKRSAPLYPNPTYNATIALPTARLKMNNGSKVTLQILLAVMFVCGSLAYLLTDMRRTLPHNPHTIAGSMSLLAGSEMASRTVVPEGAEWMTDKELRQAGVFEGYLFSLGWWNDRTPGGTSNNKKRFGIDIGRAEKEP